MEDLVTETVIKTDGFEKALRRARMEESYYGERSYLQFLRHCIEEQYIGAPTGCGGSFGELLCYELHEAGLTFCLLAEKWSVSLPTLGELIWDHCKRMEDLPHVQHGVHKFCPNG